MEKPTVDTAKQMVYRAKAASPLPETTPSGDDVQKPELEPRDDLKKTKQKQDTKKQYVKKEKKPEPENSPTDKIIEQTVEKVV